MTPPVTCRCGYQFQGETVDELVGSARGHVDEAHAELGLTDEQVRDYVTAALRTGAARPRVEQIGAMEIREVTPERLDDVLRFFDRDAFADNPACASCYCMFYHIAGEEWAQRTAAQNRAARSELIACGQARGYLAYADGEPAGWCNAGPRAAYPRYDGAEEYRVDDGEHVGSIVCFVIAPQYRRHGIARRLLDAACEGFRRQGLRVAEGYPSRDENDDASAYHGPASMYADAGFEPFRELEHQTIVRKSLTADG